MNKWPLNVKYTFFDEISAWALRARDAKDYSSPLWFTNGLLRACDVV